VFFAAAPFFFALAGVPIRAFAGVLHLQIPAARCRWPTTVTAATRLPVVESPPT